MTEEERKAIHSTLLEIEPHAHETVLASEILHEILVNATTDTLDTYHDRLIWLSGQLLDSARKTENAFEDAHKAMNTADA